MVGGTLAAVGRREAEAMVVGAPAEDETRAAAVADDMEEARGVALRVDVKPQDKTAKATGSRLKPHCRSRWVDSAHEHSVWKVIGETENPVSETWQLDPTVPSNGEVVEAPAADSATVLVVGEPLQSMLTSADAEVPGCLPADLSALAACRSGAGSRPLSATRRLRRCSSATRG